MFVHVNTYCKLFNVHTNETKVDCPSLLLFHFSKFLMKNSGALSHMTSAARKLTMKADIAVNCVSAR